MRKKILLFLTMKILHFYCFGQVLYEKGYYINNSDEKIECFIKNYDWNNNPTKISYRLTEESEKKILDVKEIKEFGIGEAVKYIHKKIKVDISRDNVNNLGEDPNPIFEERDIFLKVLVEGKANLYFYKDSKIIRFFFNKDYQVIEQLVFKKYKVNGSFIGENKNYIHQLWSNLKCPTFTIQKMNQLKYAKAELINLFSEYNVCEYAKNIDYSTKNTTEKDIFSMSIKPRITQNSMSIQNNIDNRYKLDKESKLGFGLGIEAELFFPINKNKWSVFFELNYQRFNLEKIITKTNSFSTEVFTTNVNNNYFELPIGLRHYLFLNKNSVLFLNAAYTLSFNTNSNVLFTYTYDNLNMGKHDLKIRGNPNVGIGIGYRFKDVFSLELRYMTNRNILADYVYWKGDFNSVALIFGYCFIKEKR